MKKLLMIGIVFMPLLANVPTAGAKMLEKDYVKKHCEGIVEYKNPDKTRIDCLTDTQAMEYDFGSKWAECVSQALYYGELTGKEPVCVLILDKDEKRFLERAKKLKSTKPSQLKIKIIAKEKKKKKNK
ncbi:MAG: hypothetical protein N4A43_01360 [Alphaproteobacteria bacterium]|jgi:hypothetical protein|nr:hypothetical protein [Alphaproteobacteria bacterium]